MQACVQELAAGCPALQHLPAVLRSSCLQLAVEVAIDWPDWSPCAAAPPHARQPHRKPSSPRGGLLCHESRLTPVHTRRLHLQSDAMEARMRASEAAAAQQAQQGREIAARFSEQSAKNQHDSRRDHHFEQRLMLQVRCSLLHCTVRGVKSVSPVAATPASQPVEHSGHRQCCTGDHDAWQWCMHSRIDCSV
jgi:hypothetical protein